VRRADRTARTRQALIDAALDLFAEKGYDSTTTDEIGERAGVSPRTFFRYFPTKETVLFFGREDFFRSFADHFLAQPRSRPDADAMLASFLALVPTVTPLRPRIERYNRALASSAVLRGRDAELRADQVTTMARTIRDRRADRGDEDRSELLAAIGEMLMARVLDRWLAGPEDEQLSELLVDEFGALRELFERPGPARSRRS
jgi:AcrR family transcriptional regulator